MRPLIKYHGGKFYLKDWVMSKFPIGYESMHYWEPFIGGGSILLNKNQSLTETATDIDDDLIILWNVVKNQPDSFVNDLLLEEYSEKIFESAKNATYYHKEQILLRATHKYIIHRMSRGGIGESFAWSDRLRGGQPGDKNAWDNAIKNIPKISDRIKNVMYHTYDVFSVDFKKPNTFFYLDPPYIDYTRVSKNAYKYEMTVGNHIQILSLISSAKNNILVSGYDNPIYNELLKSWNKFTKEMPNHSGQNKIKQKRIECLWANY